MPIKKNLKSFDMKKTIRKIAVPFILGTLMLSCTTLDVQLPKGPKGEDGMSAYELWVKSVKDGTIKDWDGGTELEDYYKYLKRP